MARRVEEHHEPGKSWPQKQAEEVCSGMTPLLPHVLAVEYILNGLL
jgi:hypothetical protein